MSKSSRVSRGIPYIESFRSWQFHKTYLRNDSTWLFATFSGLIAIHLSLTWQADDGSLLGSAFVYWVAVFSMVWTKKGTIKLNSSVVGMFSGAFLLSLTLVKSAHIQGYDPFLRLLPLASMLGISLIAVGFSGIKQFRKEVAILLFLVPPPSLLERLIDTSPVTAKFSTALLWYTGFDVVREGNFIFIPNGGVEVYSGCSGIDSMLHLLGLSVVFVAIFPTKKVQKLILPIFSIVIAFATNGIRVGLMALLSEPVNRVAFEYWHKGDGSLLFSIISVALLAAYCFFIAVPKIPSPETSSVEDLTEEVTEPT
ncbi:MAG: cyanoexosortase A [Cyanobacteria bacterium P01_C01_bin.69]